MINSAIEDLHNRAMEFTDLAIISKQRGNNQEALNYFGQAFKYEEKAAIMSISQNIGQPTIGVLLRSAATLAVDKGDLDKMLSLTRKALILNVPQEIKKEFRQLIDNSGIRNIEFSIESIDRILVQRASRRIMDNLGTSGAKNKQHSKKNNKRSANILRMNVI